MLRKALAAVCLFLAAVTSAHAQNNQNRGTNYTVRGRLLSDTLLSDNIQVSLELGAQTLRTVYADIAGGFEFQRLLPGDYYLIVKIPGYEDVRQSVQSAPASLSDPVNIHLVKQTVKVVQVDKSPSTIDVADLNRDYPKKAVDEFEAAQDENRKGNTAKAAERLEHAVSIAPKFYSAHNSLGIAYQKLRRYNESEREFRRARELNPHSADPLVNLGGLFIQEADDAVFSDVPGLRDKSIKQALDILKMAVELNPRSGSAFYLLGRAEFESAIYADAETNLKRALDLDNHLVEVRLVLANLYIRQMKWHDALTNLDAYLAENPDTNRTDIQDTRSKLAHNLEIGVK
jgi:Tfp pilus assembly protein PilF